MKICVLIPAYNEAKTIQSLVEEVRKYIPDVLVIDDGSIDKTAPLAESAQAKVCYQPINRGKGAILRQGFEEALRQGFDWVLTMDADGQHSPQDIPVFLEKTQQGTAGMVIGNRLNDRGEMPAVRWVTNHLMSFLISRLVHQEIPDTQCGFRLIHRDILQKVQLESARFDIESELVIQTVKSGFKITSVPIRSIYDGQTSQIRPIKDTIRFIRLLCRSFF